ncbi:hypothetical protein CEUSTIGMA_g12980.t1 [Chlamydomonas eustigma]|uniref:Ribosomal biogenesis protein LAS1L n=1 Tax=Chlamydomonas eustigma TaxID=1157962 RepID=A0A250XR90_9CHLO|nr:hypothetical protein CEUSTIGMA_g12980.t1 [Chlamydomonas eustigma]|eukprot:GAX85565.1 hypothetical protein CEUSTIGMA_g12980.t1 [Chlamydomonas eustigma]
MSRLVPWRDWSEWSNIKDALHSEVEKEVIAGIDVVAAWRLRGKLPLAVETTASLVEADLLFQQRQKSSSTTSTSHLASPSSSAFTTAQLSEYSLRLRYALPLIKLVNGVADSQQRGRAASSVAVLSEVAGLPRCVVDLRHDAAHHELPSLYMLRLGARQALEWLRNSYWAAQEALILNSRQQLADLLSQLLSSCREACGVRGPQFAQQPGVTLNSSIEEDIDEGNEGVIEEDIDEGNEGEIEEDIDEGNEGVIEEDIDEGNEGVIEEDIDEGNEGVIKEDIDEGNEGVIEEDIDEGNEGSRDRLAGSVLLTIPCSDVSVMLPSRTAMQLLHKAYPHLRPMLLIKAVTRVCEAAKAAAASKDGLSSSYSRQSLRSYPLALHHPSATHQLLGHPDMTNVLHRHHGWAHHLLSSSKMSANYGYDDADGPHRNRQATPSQQLTQQQLTQLLGPLILSCPIITSPTKNDSSSSAAIRPPSGSTLQQADEGSLGTMSVSQSSHAAGGSTAGDAVFALLVQVRDLLAASLVTENRRDAVMKQTRQPPTNVVPLQPKSSISSGHTSVMGSPDSKKTFPRDLKDDSSAAMKVLSLADLRIQEVHTSKRHHQLLEGQILATHPADSALLLSDHGKVLGRHDKPAVARSHNVKMGNDEDIMDNEAREKVQPAVSTVMSILDSDIINVEEAERKQEALLEALLLKKQMNKRLRQSGSAIIEIEENGTLNSDADVTGHDDPDIKVTVKRTTTNRERWELVEGPWSSCAIGTLPCAFNSSGRPASILHLYP